MAYNIFFNNRITVAHDVIYDISDLTHSKLWHTEAYCCCRVDMCRCVTTGLLCDPPLSHPSIEEKIMVTQNRPISQTSFIWAQHGLTERRTGGHKSPEPNAWVTLININLFGGETWVSWTNQRHMGCEEGTRHSHRRALFHYLCHLWDEHLNFWCRACSRGELMEENRIPHRVYVKIKPQTIHIPSAGSV